nr:NAD-dependent protein deacylase 2 [Candidatus Prometheoarchaeum syntrophicum]
MLGLEKNNYQKASNWILTSKYTVVFTGAGISVESGIPPFRGENGLWSKYNPIFLETNYFRAHPKKSWELIKEIFYDFFGQAKPNESHRILAKWEKNKLIQTIITQNIDNLHHEAGSKNILEFHGTAQTLSCIDCNMQYCSKKFLNSLPPHCSDCGGLLKPDFVFFSEPIPTIVHQDSITNAKIADLFILVGTTGEIMPASMIPYVAKENGAKFIEINVNPSKYTKSITDIFLQGKATDVFMKLDKKILSKKEEN